MYSASKDDNQVVTRIGYRRCLHEVNLPNNVSKTNINILLYTTRSEVTSADTKYLGVRYRLVPCTFFENSNGFHFVEVVQWFEDRIPVEKDPSLDPVGQENCKLIRRVLAGWYSEHIVEFFKSSLFRF